MVIEVAEVSLEGLESGWRTEACALSVSRLKGGESSNCLSRTLNPEWGPCNAQRFCFQSKPTHMFRLGRMCAPQSI